MRGAEKKGKQRMKGVEREVRRRSRRQNRTEAASKREGL